MPNYTDPTQLDWAYDMENRKEFLQCVLSNKITPEELGAVIGGLLEKFLSKPFESLQLQHDISDFLIDECICVSIQLGISIEDRGFKHCKALAHELSEVSYKDLSRVAMTPEKHTMSISEEGLTDMGVWTFKTAYKEAIESGEIADKDQGLHFPKNCGNPIEIIINLD